MVGAEKLSQMADALSFQVRKALACQFGSLHNLTAADTDSAASIISENAYHILRANMDFAEYCRIVSGTDQDFPKKIEVCHEMQELCEAIEFFAVRLQKNFSAKIPKCFLYVDVDPEKFQVPCSPSCSTRSNTPEMARASIFAFPDQKVCENFRPG
jgi:hypothetical protein